MKKKIMIVEDNISLGNHYQILLTDRGYLSCCCKNSDEVYSKFHDFKPDLLLLDIRLKDSKENGLAIFRNLIKNNNFNSEVIVLSGEASREEAAESIKLGAYTFIEKTSEFNIDKFFLDIENALNLKQQKDQIAKLKKDISNLKIKRNELLPLIGNSKVMEIIRKKIDRFSKFETDILIVGNTGTGKEIVANNLHYLSDRQDNTFVRINCGALPLNLIESELFGYEKGAFTGADRQKKGLIETGKDGTVFLDEIETLSVDIQAKLLRVLENREIYRLGSINCLKINSRFIFGTNISTESQVESGKMREDFYFRLDSAVKIELPELQNRGKDIVELFLYFLHLSMNEYNISIKLMADDSQLFDILSKHNWQGNVREMKNFCTKLILNCEEDSLTTAYISAAITKRSGIFSSPADIKNILKIENFKESVAGFEKKYLQYHLAKNGGKKEFTAEKIGLERTTLYKKMKKLGLN